MRCFIAQHENQFQIRTLILFPSTPFITNFVKTNKKKYYLPGFG